MKKQPPAWGKTIGILMIIFGSLGAFAQFYKIIFPNMIRMQQRMMNEFSQAPMYAEGSSFQRSTRLFDEMTGMSQTQEYALYMFGFLGLVGCVLYIIGGVKLLNARPQNYNFAKYSLIGFLILNVSFLTIILSSGPSFFIIAIMFYPIFGLVIDVVLTIILLASDKSKYGIGVPHQTADVVDARYDSDSEIV